VKKTKIIAILTAFVIMTAMAGIAAANPEGIGFSPLHASDLPIDGTTYTYTLTVITTAADSHYLEVNTDTSEMEVRVVGPIAGAGGYTAGATSWATTTPESMLWSATTPDETDGTTYTFDLEVRAKNPPATESLAFKIIVHDNEGTTYTTGVDEQATGTCHGTTIPEFATIAIPAVAILGLFLFFNHRKRREE
jgi:hypothetical protein